ncbi:hypothetical protein T310_9919, partial [Rasamsonia emersonii CBS 393.64]
DYLFIVCFLDLLLCFVMSCHLGRLQLCCQMQRTTQDTSRLSLNPLVVVGIFLRYQSISCTAALSVSFPLSLSLIFNFSDLRTAYRQPLLIKSGLHNHMTSIVGSSSGL